MPVTRARLKILLSPAGEGLGIKSQLVDVGRCAQGVQGAQGGRIVSVILL